MKSRRNPKGYVPIRQKPSCCVPASLQMIMMRYQIKGYSQETLGNLMGLTIPPELKRSFSKAAVSKVPPPTGYGTRIHLKEFSLSTVFNKLNLPFKAEVELVSDMKNVADLKRRINRIVNNPKLNAMMCVQSGALEGDPDPSDGHIIVLTGANDKNIYYIDPGCREIQKTTYAEMFEAMRLRGRENWGGLWKISEIEKERPAQKAGLGPG